MMALLIAAQAPVELPRIIESLPCQSSADEVVVCGRRPSIERYRIPPALREEPLTSRNYSWSGRARDEREADRFGGQTVGPGGFLLDGRRVDCAWRAERQAIAGLMPDCTRHVRTGPTE